jgi:hypothetical protein
VKNEKGEWVDLLTISGVKDNIKKYPFVLIHNNECMNKVSKAKGKPIRFKMLEFDDYTQSQTASYYWELGAWTLKNRVIVCVSENRNLKTYKIEE